MTIRRFVAMTAYPGLLIGAVLLSLWTLNSGGNELLAATLPSLLGACLILLLQRLMAYREEWRGWKQDLGLDLIYLLMSSWLVPGLIRAFGFGLLYLMAAFLATTSGASLWPSEWHLLLQLCLALVIGEFGNYWMHRWMHESSLGWKIHFIHHSSERLYLLSSARGHPLNVLLIYSATVVPTILLGASPELLVLLTAFTSVNGALQHANIDFDLRGWNWLLAGTDVHRVHHSTVIDEGHGNYGGNLIIWDVVFGTRYLHDDPEHPVDVGVLESELPKGFLRQLLVPFAWDRMVRDRSAEVASS